jgi:general secretion pathway protein F
MTDIIIIIAIPILFLLGVGLRMVPRLVYGARGSYPNYPIFALFNTFGWILILVPLLGFAVAGAMGLSILLILIIGIALVEWALGRRAMQRQAVWGVLRGTLPAAAGMIDQNFVAGTLRLHQPRFSGIVGRAYRRLVTALEQGADLPAAIRMNHQALPRKAQAYAAIDAAIGPEACPDLRAGGQSSGAWQQFLQHALYLGTIGLFMLAVLTYLMISVIPDYRNIYYDFDLELPAITRGLISLCGFMNTTGILALLTLALMLILLLGLLSVLLILCDVPVHQPLVDRLFFSAHRASVLRLLALTAERGTPFASNLERLARGSPSYPSSLVRKRLSAALAALAAGADWKEALHRGSLIKRADFPLLESSQAAGNLPWALRMLADQKMRIMVFRYSALEQICFPLMVLLLGLMVLWVCTALFLPLVSLIEALC